MLNCAVFGALFRPLKFVPIYAAASNSDVVESDPAAASNASDNNLLQTDDQTTDTTNGAMCVSISYSLFMNIQFIIIHFNPLYTHYMFV